MYSMYQYPGLPQESLFCFLVFRKIKINNYLPTLEYYIF